MKNFKLFAQSVIVAATISCAFSCKKEAILEEKLDINNLATTATPTGREFTLVPDASGRLLIDNSSKTYQPGDIINLKGTFKSVQVINTSGSAIAPITIRNVSGTTVNIGDPAWNGGGYSTGLVLWNCHYIKLGGQSGNTSMVINGSKQAAKAAYYDLQIGNKSDNIEISNLTIQDGGNGIVAKTDPVKNDASTAYPNTVMQNLSIHDIVIKNTTNEAMYIGHTATYWDLTSNVPYYGAASGFTAGHQYVQPIIWRNVKIYNNVVSNIGLDGIQTSAIDQLEVHNNEVSNWATQKNYAHNGGILIGGRTTNTNTHDNYVHDGWGELCQFYGSGENGSKHTIVNNLFRNGQLDGISMRGSANAIVVFSNNTVAYAAGNLIRINGSGGQTSANILNSNALIAPRNGTGTIYDKNYIYLENSAIVTEGTGTYANKKFVTSAAAGASANNYYLPLTGSLMGTAGYRRI
ncbi:right-handed parallel beta-helix repeat-containing protein [Chitinophaga rhizophila]|uniref:Right-handed parallel beta-helix repeat-containing protein n=1 Tax=Chitinophaga rhizophila TaxID=2866212 RepID=A0ABS7GAM8_9BACT|nr:right-handed parallel beta-helix repeat-containing protein [Chitinophaga rhizophila]MBW8684714.1 right-handed parallel beta-helix repeat-containing protein [Chitinophaga rhizophila]